MNTIGERLKEERLRLGFSEHDFGSIGGVQKNAQYKYENDENKTRRGLFRKYLEIGCDVQYIITGIRGVITHVESFPKIEGLEEISIEDMEKSLEIVRLQCGSMIKWMKKIRSVKAD